MAISNTSFPILRGLKTSFFGFPKKAANTFFHTSSSLTNKNYQEARRRIREADKNKANELSLKILTTTLIGKSI